MNSNDITKDKGTKAVVVRSIPQDIHHQARIRCAVDQTTLQAVLLAAITEYASGGEGHAKSSE